MRLVDTTMAAQCLNVSERTIRRYVADGTLTNHGDTNRLLIAWTELRHLDATRRTAHQRRLRDRLTSVR